MHQKSSYLTLLGGALLGVALFSGCVTESDSPSSPDTSGVGGGNNTAGTSQAGAAGSGAGAAGESGSAGAAGDGGAAGTGGTAGSGGTAGAGGDGGTAGTAGAAGTGGNGEVPAADLRLVHLVPDLSAIDVCLKVVGSDTWQGPIFKNANAADQFYYPGVSSYLQVDAGQWEIRAVAENAPDCTTALPGVVDQPLALGADKSYTVVFQGSAAFAVKISAIEDRGAPAAGKVGYQAINGVTEVGAADFGLLDESKPDETVFYPVAENILPLTSGKTGDYDPSGFRPAWLQTGTNPPVLLGLSPAIDAQAGDVYAAFLHGTKPSNPKPELQPAAIICRNYLTIGEKTEAGEYATEGNIISKNCLYGPTGQ
ncbi:MAG: DUF4397 domain-containing protein [Myxococcales bacterium]|nr:DUF4397 domain-containing protein [Polyangiaceae bacterium]MDW8251190.1 DUF4397 domain-containing protein [Myxococcales bacterium]